MIRIVSGPVHSGKTSRLTRWIEDMRHLRYPDAGGVLAPSEPDGRCLVSVRTGEHRKLELSAQDRQNTNVQAFREEDVLSIGKYLFRQSVFSWARELITQDLQRESRLIVLDEIGPLELADSGLEPGVTMALDQYRKRLHTEKEFHLVMVVREKLLQEFLDTYGVDAAGMEWDFLNLEKKEI